jgi:hypothetical protein
MIIKNRPCFLFRYYSKLIKTSQMHDAIATVVGESRRLPFAIVGEFCVGVVAW